MGFAWKTVAEVGSEGELHYLGVLVDRDTQAVRAGEEAGELHSHHQPADMKAVEVAHMSHHTADVEVGNSFLVLAGVSLGGCMNLVAVAVEVAHASQPSAAASYQRLLLASSNHPQSGRDPTALS